MIWNVYELFLWGFATALLIICSIQYLNKASKTDIVNEKLIALSYSSVWFGIALFVIFILLSDLQIQGTYENQTFYGNYKNVNLIYEILIRIANISVYLSFSFFFYAYDRISKRSKYFFTILNTIAIIIMIILPFTLLIEFLNYYIIVFAMTFMYILFKYSKWASIELKAVSSFILFGSLLILMGLLLGSYITKSINVIPLGIAPILLISGTLINLAPTVINPKFFSRGINYWKWYAMITFTIPCALLIYFIFYKFPLAYIIVWICIILFVVYYDYYTISTIKTQKIFDSKEEQRDVLRAFTKPQKITEEEVSISKEKKICLVCKGKVFRNNIYLCPECSTFYCSKCSEALSDLENACWVCEVPFDESKPVNLLEKKEEDVIVKGVDQKKNIKR